MRLRCAALAVVALLATGAPVRAATVASDGRQISFTEDLKGVPQTLELSVVELKDVPTLRFRERGGESRMSAPNQFLCRISDNGRVAECPLADIARIGIDLGDGDDVLRVAGTGQGAVGVQMTVSGGDGSDELSGGTGNDTVTGDTGDDRLRGGAGSDFLTGGAGSDLLAGDAGDDFLEGGAQDDGFQGGPGTDSVIYNENDAAGVTATIGAASVDAAGARAGDDGNSADDNPRGRTVDGVPVRDDIGGDVERVTGTSGPDSLAGDESDDELLGAGGPDVLDGKGGRDALSGGEGDDRLLARDDVADRTIDCEGGNDTAALDNVDPDPAECEQVERAAGGGGPDGQAPPPRLAIVTGSARLTSRGTIRLKLRCVAAVARCAGMLRLTSAKTVSARVGRRTVKVKAGARVGAKDLSTWVRQTAKVEVGLGLAFRQVLARRGPLKVTAALRAVDESAGRSGRPGKARRTITVNPAR
jgi:hypothetical protein